MIGETQLLKKTDIQHHLVAARRYSTFHSASKTLSTHSYPPHDTDKNTINQHFINVTVTTPAIWSQRPGYGLFGYIMKYRSYLSIVLKHLIALHVVTLEHDDGSVEAGDVQTEVICPDFFIRRV